MTAAQSIKTPVMNLPLREPSEAIARQLASRLRRISFAECLTGMPSLITSVFGDITLHEWLPSSDLLRFI